MAFIPAANTVQAELRYVWNQQKCENVLNFYDASGWTLGAMATLATDLFAWWTAHLKPIQSNTAVLNEIYITDLTTNTSPTHSYVPAGANAGSSGNASVPNSVAMCVSLRTAARGRTARGRNYVLGLQQVAVTANIWAPTTIAAVEAGYQALASGASPTPGVLAIVSRYENNVPRAAAVVRPVISAVVVDNIIDNQRRRLPGRGT